MAAHLAGDRRVQLAHHRLDVAVARFPHHRPSAERGDAIEQRAARLDVGDDRRAGECTQHRLDQNGQDLVAAQHAALAVDRADPVPVAVEGHAEMELLRRDQRAEVGKVGVVGGIGMMMREIAVDVGEQQVMLTRQQLDELLDRRASGAVPRVPADAQRAGAAFRDAADIGIEHVDGGNAPGARFPIPRLRHPREIADRRAEHRATLVEHLEAVVIAGIVAACYLYPAIHG